MAAARDADAAAVGPGGADGGPERVDGVGRDDTVDPRGVELRLNVVESRALRRREPPATAGQATDDVTVYADGNGPVGATENVRGPSEQWGCQGNKLPGISANSYYNIMGGSRRGTLNINWFKPDLLAPGSNVASLRSSVWSSSANSLCDTSNGPQPYPFSGSGNTYLGGSGTSFSAPAAAGAALLASRVYAERVLPGCASTACNAGAASPALLKAMLVMAARSMRGGDDQAIAPWWLRDQQVMPGDLVRPTQTNHHFYRATKFGYSSASVEPQWQTGSGSITLDNGSNSPDWQEAGSTLIGKLPNNRQGFGRIDLEDVLSTYPARDYVNENYTITNPNAPPWTRTYQVHDATLPVKVVLTWTDDPAIVNESTADPSHVLVNDLNLIVETGSPCNTRYLGNFTTVLDEARGEESTGISCLASSSEHHQQRRVGQVLPVSKRRHTIHRESGWRPVDESDVCAGRVQRLRCLRHRTTRHTHKRHSHGKPNAQRCHHLEFRHSRHQLRGSKKIRGQPLCRSGWPTHQRRIH